MRREYVTSCYKVVLSNSTRVFLESRDNWEEEVITQTQEPLDTTATPQELNAQSPVRVEILEAEKTKKKLGLK